MTEREETLLTELALGTVADADRAEAEALAASSPQARALFDELTEAFSLVGDALPPVAPSPGGRARLLAAADPRPRLAAMLQAFADFLDVAREKARDILDRVDDATAWEGSPWPGVALMHLPNGPRLEAAVDVGLVHVTAGTRFPYHEHVGGEEVLVLQGGFVDHADGSTWTAGDVARKAPGTRHAYTALEGPDLIYAVALFGPLEFPEPP